VWSGEPSQGEEFMDKLKALGTPLLNQVGPMSDIDRLKMFDGEVIKGRHYALQTRWLPELTPGVVASLVAAGSKRTSRFAMIALHHFHGAATRIPVNGSAFGIRQEHFLVEAIAAWDPEDENNGAVHRGWARDLSRVLAPSALPGGYANLLGPDDHDQIPFAYGPNIERLLKAKQRFDPDNVFSAIPLSVRRPGETPTERPVSSDDCEPTG
jgi:hypothetical protein